MLLMPRLNTLKASNRFPWIPFSLSHYSDIPIKKPKVAPLQVSSYSLSHSTTVSFLLLLHCLFDFVMELSFFSCEGEEDGG